MKVSVLIPAYNEEPTIKACVQACLTQSRIPDQIIVVNDGSSDGTRDVLRQFKGHIMVVDTPRNTGAKSRAQEYGMRFVTGDVLVMTDADTILSKDFVERVEKKFADPKVHAVAGYIKSIPHNWITACRELDYIIGQDVHKRAQSNLDSVLVIPGCAAAFRMATFRKYINFEHDTLTEDLDFTYKLHRLNMKIYYDVKAVVYTQDPDTLPGYINQTRRWISGGWQNLAKHFSVIKSRRGHALEVGLIYIEGMVFGSLFFILPMINVEYFIDFLIGYFLIALVIGSYGVIKRKRWDLMRYAPLFPFVLMINSVIFFEQFIKQIILRRRDVAWFKPARRVLRGI